MKQMVAINLGYTFKYALYIHDIVRIHDQFLWGRGILRQWRLMTDDSWWWWWWWWWWYIWWYMMMTSTTINDNHIGASWPHHTQILIQPGFFVGLQAIQSACQGYRRKSEWELGEQKDEVQRWILNIKLKQSTEEKDDQEGTQRGGHWWWFFELALALTVYSSIYIRAYICIAIFPSLVARGGLLSRTP